MANDIPNLNITELEAPKGSTFEERIELLKLYIQEQKKISQGHWLQVEEKEKWRGGEYKDELKKHAIDALLPPRATPKSAEPVGEWSAKLVKVREI